MGQHMSQEVVYVVPMIRSPRSNKCPVPLALSWKDGDAAYRLTSWPEAKFERRYGAEWVAITPSEEELLAGAAGMDPQAWSNYLEFAPAEVREFLGFFRTNRLVALQLVTRCPGLLGLLLEAPAMTTFLAAHARTPSNGKSRWGELSAVFDRSGVYGTLDWLGLPASRQTLAILQNLVTPDLPGRLLEPLRRMLWKPEGILALAQLPEITERELSPSSHALAA